MATDNFKPTDAGAISRIISDQEQKEVIIGYCNTLEFAIKTARSNMTSGVGCNPKIVDMMFVFIANYARSAQSFKWPDPAARAAQAARADPALQKLIKRASNPTPIQAK